MASSTPSRRSTSGNSLKDQVVKTSRKLDELAQQNAAEHVDLAGQIQNVKDEANRWHDARHKGDKT